MADTVHFVSKTLSSQRKNLKKQKIAETCENFSAVENRQVSQFELYLEELVWMFRAGI